FPQPVILDLLLRSGPPFGEDSGAEMALHTLGQMARGGMRDQLGGGFHRYSVDARWLVPHFEKMLYDNALLARAYSDAAVRFGDRTQARIAEETLDDVIADLGAPGGAFYSARDADSEGEEGTFYLWTPAQVNAQLPAPEAALVRRVYDITDVGNFEGRNILHLPHDLDAVARSEGMARSDLDEVLSRALAVLKTVRAQRDPPLLDDKILTGWNGMTIRALAEVGAAHGRTDLVERALKATDFLAREARKGDLLYHVHAGGSPAVEGFLEDYGALGNGALSLYEATLEPDWLELAFWCADSILDRFWDSGEGLMYDASKGGETLLVRPRDIMDNATPSGNSLAMELLARLAPLGPEERYADIVARVLEREAGAFDRYPTAVARLAVAGIRAYAPKLEITVIGTATEVTSLLDTAHGAFHPNRQISGGDPADRRVAALSTTQERLGTSPRAFVCRGSTCLEPVGDAQGLARLLDD
ncbi:MAG: thioredoxin domain-containing protein, partial [Gemmatimonadota bacterium]|nr:thioredoxin domain-containing protein [Gemmatimonadota bacterium]